VNLTRLESSMSLASFRNRTTSLSLLDPARVREHNNAFTEIRLRSLPFIMEMTLTFLPQTLKSLSSREEYQYSHRCQDHNHPHSARTGLCSFRKSPNTPAHLTQISSVKTGEAAVRIDAIFNRWRIIGLVMPHSTIDQLTGIIPALGSESSANASGNKSRWFWPQPGHSSTIRAVIEFPLGPVTEMQAPQFPELS
jgi:hypothetical protein